MGRSTVSSILKETCEAIWTVLQPDYVKAPSSSAEWMGVSKQFEQLWNFPNCIGLCMTIKLITHFLLILIDMQVQLTVNTSLFRHQSMPALRFITTKAPIPLFYLQCVMLTIGQL